MRAPRHLLTAAVLAVGAVAADRPALGQQSHLPPVRALGPQVALTSDSVLRSVTDLRQLSDGRVLVNDGTAQRLFMFDKTLAHATIVADSTASTNKAYGDATRTALLPYRGDTTLFVDPLALDLLVLDPAGHIARVLSVPHPNDIGSLAAISSGAGPGGGGFDAKGRLIYRITGAGLIPGGIHFGPAGIIDARNGKNLDGTPSTATDDSAPVVRVDLTTHQTDTIGFSTWRRGRPMTPAKTPEGWDLLIVTIEPVRRSADAVAFLADGSTAIIRAQDYHIDWIDADGSRRSTPKMAHEWIRISDSAKAAIVDSTRQVYAAMQTRRDSQFKAQGFHPNYAVQNFTVVDPSELPDYLSPFPSNGVKADADTNIWIRELALPPAPGQVPEPAIYDIVSREGVVVDRVQVPPQFGIAGFGPGVAYLTLREGPGTVLAKYRIR